MTKPKYKIRISKDTYYSLYSDMTLFNFYKANGTLNQNKFFNTLITGFSSNLKYRKEQLGKQVEETLKKHIHNKNTLSQVTEELNTMINKIQFSDTNTKYHSEEIYITPTNETKKMYDYIEANELKDISMSEFIRNLLIEYTNSPIYERERCLYWDNILSIHDAINMKQVILLKSNKGTQTQLLPYVIALSKEGTFNYVVGIDASDSSVFSLKISNIQSITLISRYYDFKDEEIEKLEEALEFGAEYICKNAKHAIIRFDDIGFKIFEATSQRRPDPSDFNCETNEMIFDMDLEQLFEYLLQFGKHAKVIEPLELKTMLNNFHKEAIDE